MGQLLKLAGVSNTLPDSPRPQHPCQCHSLWDQHRAGTVGICHNTVLSQRSCKIPLPGGNTTQSQLTINSLPSQPQPL